MQIDLKIVFVVFILFVGCQQKTKTKEEVIEFMTDYRVTMAGWDNSHQMEERLGKVGKIFKKLRRNRVYPDGSELKNAKEQISKYESDIAETIKELKELGELDADIPVVAISIELLKGINELPDLMKKALRMAEKKSPWRDIKEIVEMNMEIEQKKIKKMSIQLDSLGQELDRKYFSEQK